MVVTAQAVAVSAIQSCMPRWWRPHRRSCRRASPGRSSLPPWSSNRSPASPAGFFFAAFARASARTSSVSQSGWRIIIVHDHSLFDRSVKESWRSECPEPFERADHVVALERGFRGELRSVRDGVQRLHGCGVVRARVRVTPAVDGAKSKAGTSTFTKCRGGEYRSLRSRRKSIFSTRQVKHATPTAV